jgi:quercetin 2,3-dioxygenase
MDKKRSVVRIVTGFPTRDGAGVRLHRMIGHEDTKAFDPFLMLDLFHSSDPKDYMAGFPWHPHRGIETVTFMVAGAIAHGDSLGHAGTIGGGDVQWMSAGSGIIHQEMPVQSPDNWGLQLWVNLPAARKMMHPRYQDVPADHIPVVTEPGCRIRVVAGARGDVTGPVVGIEAAPSFLDVSLERDASCRLPVDPASTCFAVIITGSLVVEREDGKTEEVSDERVLLYGAGESVVLKAGTMGARALLVSGRPLGEPVAWGGPIVMNTKEELRLAFRELEEGTFLKHA